MKLKEKNLHEKYKTHFYNSLQQPISEANNKLKTFNSLTDTKDTNLNLMLAPTLMSSGHQAHEAYHQPKISFSPLLNFTPERSLKKLPMESPVKNVTPFSFSQQQQYFMKTEPISPIDTSNVTLMRESSD